MENLTQSWIQSGAFFQNKGTFFDFQKRGWDACPSLVAQLLRYAFLKLSIKQSRKSFHMSCILPY